MKSSPKNVMQVECVDHPLFLRRQYLADCFILMACSISNHPLIPLLESLSHEVSVNTYWSHKTSPPIINSFLKLKNLPSPLYTTDKNPLFQTDFEDLVHTPRVILDYGIDKEDPAANIKFKRELEKWQDWLPIFTDASKLDSDGCVGVAVWIPKFHVLLSQKCPHMSSVFTGQSVAILEAIAFAESHNIAKVIIFSDAKSCLQAIVGNHFKMKTKFPLILKIKQLLNSCEKKGLQITLAWIPGHCGIEGNESADMWAKEAIEVGSQVHNNIFASDLTMKVRSDMKVAWQSLWDSSRLQKGRFYGNIQPTIPRKPWFFRFRSASKQVTSTICRLRIGHICTPVFLAKIRVRDNSLCECGMDEGTLDHIFFNCNRFSTSLYDMLPKQVPRPINFPSLLSIMDPPLTDILLKYINVYNIKL